MRLHILTKPSPTSKIHSAIKPFIIFGHARSGTGRLIHTLSQHPEIYCDGEIFNIHSSYMHNHLQNLVGRSFSGNYYRADQFRKYYLRTIAKKEEKSVIGFKIFASQLPQSIQERWLLDQNNKIILLWRRNILQARISLEIVIRTNQICLRNNGEKRVLPEPFSINLDHMELWMKEHQEWIIHCRNLLNAHNKKYVECIYEDWNQSSFLNVLQYLVQTPMQDYKIVHRKLITRTYYDYIQNLDAVRKRFEGSRYGYIDDEIKEQTW